MEKAAAEEQSLAGSQDWSLEPVAAAEPESTELPAVVAGAALVTGMESSRWSSLVAAGQVKAAAFQGEAERLAAEDGGVCWSEEPGAESE